MRQRIVNSQERRQVNSCLSLKNTRQNAITIIVKLIKENNFKEEKRIRLNSKEEERLMPDTTKVKQHLRRIRYPSGSTKYRTRVSQHRRRIVKRGILGRLFN